MERNYTSGTTSTVTLFIGTEIEKTPAEGLKTLFVVGVQEPEELIKLATWYNCTHIYFGANQSFASNGTNDVEFWSPWEHMIRTCLEADFWCTLDFDVSETEAFLESGLTEYRRFIPQISVKVPYLQLLGYNATIKIDDKDFEASNPGVWCVPLSELTKREYFTNWDGYGKDEIVK